MPLPLETRVKMEDGLVVKLGDIEKFYEQALQSGRYPYGEIGDKTELKLYCETPYQYLGALFGVVNTVKKIPFVIFCEAAFALSQRIKHGENPNFNFEDYLNAFGFTMMSLFAYNFVASMIRSRRYHKIIERDLKDYLAKKNSA